jgi:hypothetical protein
MASDQVEVEFSGNINTMVGISLVASALALALSVWSLSRIGDIEAFVAVQAVRAAKK